MASSKPYTSRKRRRVCSEESSEVQVLDSIEPLVTVSSSMPSSSSERVMDSMEPLVPTVQSILDEPVAGPIGIAPGSGGSQPAITSSSDEDEFVTTPVYRPTGSSGRRIHLSSDEIRSMWNWSKIFSKLGTFDQCVKFAEERGLVRTERICPFHQKPMVITRDAGQFGRFRCLRNNCRKKDESRAKGTWFEHVKMPLTLIFQIMYAFCEGLSYHLTKIELACENSPVISCHTICDWFNYCREVIAVHEIQNQRAQGKIGGPHKVVQIDELKCGKTKYNRGRQIKGHWVIGMIEDGNDDLRLEVCPDNEISAEILVPLIKKHVAEGSIIHTDSWRPYMSLPDHGYTHKIINHSDPTKFVAPDGTQKIQREWRGLKKHFRQRPKQDFTLWLGEYSWRRRIHINNLDPYEELLIAIKYVYSK